MGLHHVPDKIPLDVNALVMGNNTFHSGDTFTLSWVPIKLSENGLFQFLGCLGRLLGPCTKETQGISALLDTTETVLVNMYEYQ